MRAITTAEARNVLKAMENAAMTCYGEFTPGEPHINIGKEQFQALTAYVQALEQRLITLAVAVADKHTG